MAGRSSLRSRDHRETSTPPVFTGVSQSEMEDDLYDNEFDAEEPDPTEQAHSLISLNYSLSGSQNSGSLTAASNQPVNSSGSVIHSLVSAPNLSAQLSSVKHSSPSVSWSSGAIPSASLQTHSVVARQSSQANNLAIRKLFRPVARRPNSSVLKVRGRPRGRPPRNRGQLASVSTPLVRSVAPPSKPFETSSQVEPLVLTVQNPYCNKDTTLPMLSLFEKHDPLAALDAELESANASAQPADSQGPGSIGAPLSGRMKSSSCEKEIDIQSLKHYRRVNGYTLFVMVNKRKCNNSPGITEDSADISDGTPAVQKDNRKWQALWSTLPEKVRKEWKTKAKRLLKQQRTQTTKPDKLTDNRRAADRRRLEAQLARSETVATGLTDLAAYFQLLSESFESMAQEVSAHQGPVDPDSVCSMLLDGLLTCLIPLIALASEEELLAPAPSKETICDALKHLTYIVPL